MPNVPMTVEAPNGESYSSFAAAAEAGFEFACEWFALCERPASVALSHPVLGAVPTCTACAARVEAMA